MTTSPNAVHFDDGQLRDMPEGAVLFRTDGNSAFLPPLVEGYQWVPVTLAPQLVGSALYFAFRFERDPGARPMPMRVSM